MRLRWIVWQRPAPGGEGFLEGYGGHLHEKSHGESFLALVMNRFNGKGLYILDEPEAALSPPVKCHF
ncbi:MAG: hypothetical protein ACLR23_29495 [Clostridia bacterium]